MGNLRGTVAGAVAVALGLSGCWLQPGFNAGRTNHNPDEDTLTTETVPELSQLWATATGFGDLSPPVITGGNIYITGDNEAASLRLSTGDVRWLHEELFEEVGFAPPQVRAPAYHDGEVVAPFTQLNPGSGPGEGGVVHLDPATGEIADTTWGDLGFELAVADDGLALYSGNAGYYLGLQIRSIDWPNLPRMPLHLWPLEANHRTGSFAIVGERVLWSYDTLAEGYSEACAPYPEDQLEQYCSADWSTDLGAEPGRPVAIGTGQVAYSAGDSVFVLDAATGDILWTAGVGGQLAVDGETLFVADADGDRLVALPAAGCGADTCSPAWEADVTDLAGGPAGGGDVIYVRTETGDLHAFAADGCGADSCSPLTTVPTDHALEGDLVVAQGHVLATTSDGQVVAFGLAESPDR